MLVGLVTAALLAATPAAPAKAAAPAPRPAATPTKLKVVVMDVRATGVVDPKTVEGLSSLVASEVARRPNLTVIAGADLRTLIGYERQRQLVGCTESSCLAELAGALGAAYLVSTEYSRVGRTGLLSMTLLDSSKAIAVKRLTHRVRSEDALVDETGSAVDELLADLSGAGEAVAAGALAPAVVQPAPVAAPPPTTPGAPARPRGYHEHDGFLFATTLGGGYLHSKGGDLTVSGGSASFELALGGAVTRSLALYVTFFDEADASPTVKNDATGASFSPSNATHSLLVYGAGARYYLVPSNFFFGAMVGVGKVTFEYDDALGTTRKLDASAGPVLRLTAGKEWWISTNWGLGAAANVIFAGNKTTDVAGNSTSITSSAFNLVVSATYN
jgi:hypothetical protein